MNFPVINQKPDGSTAPLAWPEYIQFTHQDWLDGSHSNYEHNIKAYLEAALNAGSPYAFAEAYDPTEDLESIVERFAEHSINVEQFRQTNYGDYVDRAVVEVEKLVTDPAKIDAVVQAHELKQRDVLQARVRDFCSGAWGSRVADNSQFRMALAALHAAHLQEVGEFRANLELQEQRTKTLLAVQLADNFHRNDIVSLEADRAAAAALADARTRKIVGLRDYLQDELQLAEADATYELELFRYGENMLHALSGVATTAPRWPRSTSALAAMMSNFGTSATIGYQVGMASGNVALGVATGLISTLLQGWGGWQTGY